MQTRKAVITAHWHQRPREHIPVQYNPGEFTLDKQVTLGEAPIPGLDAPLQQFVRGNAEKLTLDLFCDTTEGGMGERVTSVTTVTDRIYQLIRIEPTRLPGNSLCHLKVRIGGAWRVGSMRISW